MWSSVDGGAFWQNYYSKEIFAKTFIVDFLSNILSLIFFLIFLSWFSLADFLSNILSRIFFRILFRGFSCEYSFAYFLANIFSRIFFWYSFTNFLWSILSRIFFHIWLCRTIWKISFFFKVLAATMILSQRKLPKSGFRCLLYWIPLNSVLLPIHQQIHLPTPTSGSINTRTNKERVWLQGLTVGFRLSPDPSWRHFISKWVPAIHKNSDERKYNKKKCL